MLTFLLVLILVFAIVDLIVVTIIEPLASKKKKAIEDYSYQNNANPVIKFVGATMYDGGTKKEEKKDQIEEKR